MPIFDFKEDFARRRTILQRKHDHPEHAHERVEKTRLANAKKFEIIVVEGDALRMAVKAVNDASLLKTFEHHFLPLAAA